MKHQLRAQCVGRGAPNQPQPPSAQWQTQAVAVGVDDDPPAIRGLVVCQCGPFKSENRGRFDESSLLEIQRLWPAAGLPCAAEHPNFNTDRLTCFLGRIRDPRRNVAAVQLADGTHGLVAALRADLIFDSAARKSPHGDLIDYFCSRVRNDPASLSSSLVLETEVQTGYSDLPPLWQPTALYGCDLVAVGDACGALLGHGGTNWRGLCTLARQWKAGSPAVRTAPSSAPWWTAPRYSVALSAEPAGRPKTEEEATPLIGGHVGSGTRWNHNG